MRGRFSSPPGALPLPCPSVPRELGGAACAGARRKISVCLLCGWAHAACSQGASSGSFGSPQPCSHPRVPQPSGHAPASGTLDAFPGMSHAPGRGFPATLSSETLIGAADQQGKGPACAACVPTAQPDSQRGRAEGEGLAPGRAEDSRCSRLHGAAPRGHAGVQRLGWGAG